jgi:hypothetical protein
MNRSTAFFVLLSLALLLSCQTKTGKDTQGPATPKLNKEQMIAVLIDMHLTEAALRIKPQETSQNDMYANHYYTALFRKHKTTKEDFNDAMLYYKNDLVTLNNIYMKVVDSLSRMQGAPPKK